MASLQNKIAELQLLLSSGKSGAAAQVCEELELQGTPIYSIHLLVYLIQNNLNNARFLWKRIPTSEKQSKPELPAIWKIGAAMWTRNHADVYKAFTLFSWSPAMIPIISILAESFRQRTFRLISRGYSNISLPHFAELLGLAPDDALKTAQTNGWEYDQASNTFKVQPFIESREQKTGLQQLNQLTSYVLFLE